MILKNIYLENPEEENILKNVCFLSERIMVFNAQEQDFRIFREWKIYPDLGIFSQIFIRLAWSYQDGGP